ncbi:hypothetical protein KR009_006429, partial [Drosophila setifemur]
AMNVGRFRDRNPDIRVAGIASFRDPFNIPNAKDCIPFLDTAEQAEYLIRAHCRRNKSKPYGKRTPQIPTNSVGDLLSFERSKGLRTELQEKYRENMCTKKSTLGEAMKTKSKPDSVTNLSRTFGKVIPSPDYGLYQVIMPLKTPEQVNREYGDFHDKHIVSHNHYFPAEQINRKYSKHFNRFNTFGTPAQSDRSGIRVKNCMREGEEHLIIVKKPQKDLEDRTKGPLGKKYIWYPYNIPENMTFGLAKPRVLDMRSILENTWPSANTQKLSDAISHLHMLRDSLQRREDFHMNHVLTALKNQDKENTGHLPLNQILQIMRRMHVPTDSEKIRTACSHYQLIVDEGCCSEGVKYVDLCQLLTIIIPLPQVGSISPVPCAVYNQDTTYRRLCADLHKKPNEGRPLTQPHKSPFDLDMENTRMKDIINPDLATLCGVWPSDFNQLRDKEEMERIFASIVSKDEFEAIWQRILNEHNDQNEMASVVQFRAAMKKN